MAARNTRSTGRAQEVPIRVINVDESFAEGGDGDDGAEDADGVAATGSGGAVLHPARGHDFVMKATLVKMSDMDLPDVTLQGLGGDEDMLIIKEAKPKIAIVGIFDRRYPIPPPVEQNGNWMVIVAIVHSLTRVARENPEVMEIHFSTEEEAVSFLEKVKNMPY